MSKGRVRRWPLTGAILAGGESRRMGAPKEGVILWDGRPMIEHVIEPLAVVCAQIAIVGACRGYQPDPGRGLIQIPDRYPGLGPLAGIEALLASGLDCGYLVVACDHPFLTPRVLCALLRDGDLSVPRFFQAQGDRAPDPFPGYFPSTWLPRIREALRQPYRSVRPLIAGPRVISVPRPRGLQASLRNMNSPVDLAGIRPPGIASWRRSGAIPDEGPGLTALASGAGGVESAAPPVEVISARFEPHQVDVR